MNGYRELMRRKLLEQMYDNMSDEDKRTLVRLTAQSKDHSEIMSALKQLREKADSNHHSFVSDLLANISGNFITDGLLFIGRKLIRL